MKLPTSTAVSVVPAVCVPASAEVIVLLHAEDAAPDEASMQMLPEAFHASLHKLVAGQVTRGKRREIAVDLIGERRPIRRLVLAGLGKGEIADAQSIREASAAAARYAHGQRLTLVAIIAPSLPNVPSHASVAAVVEGYLLASFRYREYRGTSPSDISEPVTPSTLTVVVGRADHDSVRQAATITLAQNLARTIASRPGNDVHPLTLQNLTRSIAQEVGLKFLALDEKQMKRLGMGGMLGVGSGSQATPPRLIALEHKPSKHVDGTVLLVGKAITFDTGGISLKPSEKMGRMIFDKCGGMAVLGTMIALAQLKLPVHVVGILAAAENHISERAYRPGDILHMFNGVTVEVTNTDAEGRLVLADALAWGIQRFKPRYCVDIATLTGGVSVALGRSMAGIMGNDPTLIDRLIAAGRKQGEKMWQLPLPDDPQEMLKSDFADIVNSAGRDAQPLQGAAFLSYFVPQGGDDGSRLPWAHLDIAGVADCDKPTPLYARGATGWGVRTLVGWLQQLAGR